MSTDDLQRAVALLLAGDLVALPTETVYGLGADAANPEAVAKIYAAKGRPADHPLIVHLAAAEHLPQWARDIPQAARNLAAAFWPGPLTLILKKQDWVPLAVTGGQDTVGLRVPAHPLALALLAAFASARASAPAGIAAPSANRFGRVSTTTAAHVREELGDKVSLILDGGPCEIGIESTIVDFSRGTPQILRPGAITAEDIARVTGALPRSSMPPCAPNSGRPREAAPAETENGADFDANVATNVAPRVSGSLAAHYAPLTPLRLLAANALIPELVRLIRAGRRVAVFARSAAPRELALDASSFHWRVAASDPAVYAQQLYSSLRTLDALGANLILVEDVPPKPEWRAIADRLARAATGSGAGTAIEQGREISGLKVYER